MRSWRGELGQLVGLVGGGDPADSLEDAAGDRRVEQRFAAADGLERRDQVAPADLLEQVAAGAGDDGRQDRVLVGVAGQHHDPRLGHLGPDLATGLDPRAVREPHVHDDEVRPEALRSRDRLGHGAGLGDDLEFRSAADESDQPLPDDLVVVDDEQRQWACRAGLRVCHLRSSSGDLGTTTSMRVPTPGSPSMLIVAPIRPARSRMLARPWWPNRTTRSRVDPDPVVLDGQRPAGWTVRDQLDGCSAGLRMAYDVAERFARDREKLAGDLVGRLHELIGDAKLEIDDRVVPVFFDERRQPADQRPPRQQLGSQTEDEVADVLDGEVDRVDRPLEAIGGLLRVVRHQLGDVLERQADPVQVLDDPVVEVLGDAVALVDDGEAIELLVEPRVLHRDPGVDREGLDERLVFRAEPGGADLVGQVQPAQGRALDRDRDAQEAGHRRVVRREARAVWVGGDVRDPERAVLADDQPEQATALRQADRSAPSSRRRCRS